MNKFLLGFDLHQGCSKHCMQSPSAKCDIIRWLDKHIHWEKQKLYFYFLWEKFEPCNEDPYKQPFVLIMMDDWMLQPQRGWHQMYLGQSEKWQGGEGGKNFAWGRFA